MLQRARSNRILALVPVSDARSDDSQSSDDEGDQLPPPDSDDCFSSPPPSIASSLERMNLLDDSETECETDTEQDVPFSPVMRAVFPSLNETNFDSIPSISSIPMLPSPSVSTIPLLHSPSIPSPLAQHSSSNITQRSPQQISTRSKRRIQSTRPRLVAKRTKRTPINFKWKKVHFAHNASVDPMPFSDPPSEEMSPRDYFVQFFSDDITCDIVHQTNIYSVEQLGRSVNITKQDIEHFIAIHIIMGVVRMPSYLDYWSNQYRYTKVAEVMPLKKYQRIRRYIHFADNSSASTDRFQKVRPVVEKVRLNCLRTAEEENQFSIDEMTLPYKGKKAGNRRQYNARKPKKWGFKAFVRSGVSGYIYDFILYGGDDTFRNVDFTQQEEALGFGGKVVVALCQTIIHKPCFVYFDNYYTSLELVMYLRNVLGIFSLGTVKANRLRGCQDFLDTDKALKKKGRGSYSQIVCNENKVAVVKWFDNKCVTLASSFVDAHPMSKIKRFSKEKKTRVDVDCPQVVKYYNSHMGGVDLADMLIALYRTQIKSRRWYMGIFAQILDICINNAWLLYRRHSVQKQLRKVLTLKEFRCHIFLAYTAKQAENPDVPGPKETIKKPVISRPIDDIRYDGFGHLPFVEERGRCRLCKNGQSSTMCTKCNVRLCLSKKRNCFVDFHVKK